MILTLEHISKSYSASPVLEDVTAKIEDRDKIGLIGPNGAGKSTLLNIICGELGADEGEIARGAGASFGFLRQNSGLSSHNSILEEMRSVFRELLEMEREIGALQQRMAEIPPGHAEHVALAERYAAQQTLFEQRDGYAIDVKVRTVLGGMGFADTDPDTPVEVLSGGEKTRLALCKLLLEQPRLLILDEPTNHLDFKTLQWLEEYLLGYRHAILVVSHDRYFLDKLCTGIWELTSRRMECYSGNYSRYLVQKEERVARRQKEYDIQQQQIAEIKDFVARNIVRASTTARAQSRQKQLERMELVERPRPPAPPPKLRFEYRREPVKDVLRVTGLTLSVGEGDERKTLFRELDFEMHRGQKIALIGANGVGKSSLLRALLGQIPRDAGRIEWGANTDISYFEQEEFGLNSKKTALGELWDRFPRESEHRIRTVLGGMGLTGEAVHKQVGSLSGGERAKLKFAILTLSCGNVLLMDEPTNHLDLAAKEALDSALRAYTGTLLVVSHDRYLLNKFPDLIAEMHPGGMRLYQGNYDRYLERKQAEPNPEAASPSADRAGKKPPAQGAYRSKKQRSEQVARQNAVAALEREIEALEARIAELEGEIADPAVAGDYILLQDKCAMLEETRALCADKLAEWTERSEQL